MEEKKKNFGQEFWGLLKPARKNIWKLLSFIFVIEAIAMIGPYFLKLIIDDVTVWDPGQIKEIVLLIILYFANEQLGTLLSYFKDRLTFSTIIDLEYHLPVLAQEKLVNLSLSYHEQEDTGSKIVKVERGLNRIIELFNSSFFEVIPTVIQTLITLVILFFVNWTVGLSFFFLAPLFAILTVKINKRLYPVRLERHKQYEAASGKMGQAILNINAVQSFVQEKREAEEYARMKDSIRRKEKWEWFSLFKFDIKRSFVIDLGRFAVLILGVYLVSLGQISVGSLVFIVTLSEKAYFSLYRLSRFYDRVAEGREAVSRFNSIIEAETEIKNKKNGLRPAKIDGKIEFKNVSFGYDQEKPALNNVTFNIEIGCMTALIGPSGGGKTTIARLIYRHYDPQAGQVLLDGVNLKDYNIHSFRRFIAIVPQEVEVFNISVRDNIAYARPDASLEEVKAAARIANASEFIEKLSAQYDTLVGERGIKLSGGQRQRLGIARAVLANPRILIFDEATSNLDSYSEKLIQEAMDKVSRGRTMIVIAHRLSTIKKADKIVVLEGGRMVEEGSHIELAKLNGGLYAKLISLQNIGDIS